MKGVDTYPGQHLTREQLGGAFASTPDQQYSHAEVVEALISTLAGRYIGIVRDEYVLADRGTRAFGLLDLDLTLDCGPLLIGFLCSRAARIRLAVTVGYRVVSSNGIGFLGEFRFVSEMASREAELKSAVIHAVDEIQPRLDEVRPLIEKWRALNLSDPVASMVIYSAFIEKHLRVPRHLVGRVHRLYFEPEYEEFRPRTLWSLCNSFTSAFQELKPIQKYRAAARLTAFLCSLKM